MSTLKFKDLLVTLLPEGSKMADAAGETRAVILVLNPPRLPPVTSTACCEAASIPYHVPHDKGDPANPLWTYLTTELAGAAVLTASMKEPSDLQSLTELEGMEKKLDEAHSELQKRKAELQKKPKVTK